ncbi:RRQRL motif-containing zinc-binding protein [Nocardiopsis sp. NRRL B-16309]|uniref:RRQRL motif-containing zinc-binding protein n=1 Tax=Nocardiopsis sp. NRRL B-16309 TaxID=1519494 RepID=UPI0006AFB88F|nr:RRQRL motif-containing zinc-binding protein [Nocardiopsis sp. NRRL B-16309]
MAHDDFFDPEGKRHGLPTYPRNLAPRGLMTRAQLLDLGLGLGGQHPVAQLMWRSRCGGSKDGVRNAWLYYVHLAAPKQPLTPAKERSLARAYIARCTCRECGEIHPYCLPTSIGRVCPPGTGCAADVRLAA